MVTDWIKRLKDGLSKMLLRSENAFGLKDTEISAIMADQINLWFQIFSGHAPWITEKTKPINLAVFSTAYLAKLINAELKIEITPPGGGKEDRANYINSIFQRFLLPKANTYTQLAAVGGQVILKPFVTESGILIEAIKANCFSPVKIDSSGKITSAVFFEYKTVGKESFVRAEYHDLAGTRYTVQNKAFRMTGGAIGREVPLSDVSGWEGIQPEITLSGIKAPLFACLQIPNANNIDLDSKLPISIYANAVTALREADEIYTGYCWEFKSAKRKVYADESAFRQDELGNKLIFPDVDLYIGLNPATMGSGISELFADYTPQIREQDYQNGINQQIRLYEAQIGVSAGTFSFDVRTGAVTATQVISEDRATYYTVSGIQSAWKTAYSDLAYAIDAYATLYNLVPMGAYTLTVEFGDSVFEDTGTEFDRRMRMVAGGIMRHEEVRQWYLNEDAETARKNLPEMTELINT